MRLFVLLYLINLWACAGQIVISGNATLSGNVQIGVVPTTSVPATFWINFEAGSDGDAMTSNLLNTATQSQIAGGWRITSNSVLLASGLSKEATAGQKTMPHKVLYNGSLQTDTGTKGISLNMSVDEVVEFVGTSSGFTLLSGGCWYVNNLTNTPNNGAQWDLIRFNDAFGQNTTVIQFFNGSGGQTSFFRAHCASNGVTQFGPQILITPPSTNWFTWLWDGPNQLWTIAVYDSTGTTQVSSNSYTGIGLNCAAKSWDIMCYGHQIYENRTNYVDNFILNTNGVFPLYPP